MDDRDITAPRADGSNTRRRPAEVVFDLNGGAEHTTFEADISSKGHGSVQAGGAVPPDMVPGPEARQEDSVDPGVFPTATLAMVDVGLPVGWAEAHPWLAAAVRAPEVGQQALWAEGTDGQPGEPSFIPVHELFVCGIIRRVARRVRILPSPVTSVTGTFREQDLVDALKAILADTSPTRPKVINMSLGGFAGDDDDVPERLHHAVCTLFDQGIAIIGAAGNLRATTKRFYPAAFEEVFAVGALTADAKPATFSNSGPWVDVWALGAGVVSAFPRMYPGLDKPPLTGWARWSGTSFAAPVFAALVADRAASKPQLSGVDAAHEVLAELPGIGIPGLTGKVLVPPAGFLVDLTADVALSRVNPGTGQA